MKSNWKMPLIIGVGVLAVIILCVFGVQSSQNKAFALEEQVNTAKSDINVQEKRRVDLVYNLADCVKQYDKHEAETLTAIVDGRGSTGDIENVTTAITAVSEAYPELKSNETYNQLMEVEKDAQEHIAELESELEVKENLLKIKNGLLGKNDELLTELIEVAQMLINSTYEYESSTLEKALFKCGETRTTERYSIDDLEQIAEHLLVYCKHNREDEKQ
jgi:LemA protein